MVPKLYLIIYFYPFSFHYFVVVEHSHSVGSLTKATLKTSTFQLFQGTGTLLPPEFAAVLTNETLNPGLKTSYVYTTFLEKLGSQC